MIIWKVGIFFQVNVKLLVVLNSRWCLCTQISILFYCVITWIDNDVQFGVQMLKDYTIWKIIYHSILVSVLVQKHCLWHHFLFNNYPILYTWFLGKIRWIDSKKSCSCTLFWIFFIVWIISKKYHIAPNWIWFLIFSSFVFFLQF